MSATLENGPGIPVKIRPAVNAPQTVSRLMRQLMAAQTITLANWTLREGRRNFSQLFRTAVENHQPQRISRRGGGAVVVVDEGDFLALLAQAPQAIPMAEYFEAVAGQAEPLTPACRRPARALANL